MITTKPINKIKQERSDNFLVTTTFYKINKIFFHSVYAAENISFPQISWKMRAASFKAPSNRRERKRRDTERAPGCGKSWKYLPWRQYSHRILFIQIPTCLMPLMNEIKREFRRAHADGSCWKVCGLRHSCSSSGRESAPVPISQADRNHWGEIFPLAHLQLTWNNITTPLDNWRLLTFRCPL